MSAPLQHTDHFVVYCRSAPVAVASFTPNLNMLELTFPQPCKPKSQNFLSSYFCRVESGHESKSEGGKLGMVNELQSFVEVEAVHGSQIDCLR